MRRIRIAIQVLHFLTGSFTGYTSSNAVISIFVRNTTNGGFHQLTSGRIGERVAALAGHVAVLIEHIGDIAGRFEKIIFAVIRTFCRRSRHFAINPVAVVIIIVAFRERAVRPCLRHAF
ncbi:hypothetical protein D3C86_1752830 [compost metagenome]